MGLDQWAAIETDEDKEPVEIASWRKHPNLQGWMENRWVSRNPGTGPYEFNCVRLYLTKDDLLDLEEAIQTEHLPETQGFFFGTPRDLAEKDGDLQFVKEALAALEAGHKVFYSSWW